MSVINTNQTYLPYSTTHCCIKHQNSTFHYIIYSKCTYYLLRACIISYVCTYIHLDVSRFGLLVLGLATLHHASPTRCCSTSSGLYVSTLSLFFGIVITSCCTLIVVCYTAFWVDPIRASPFCCIPAARHYHTYHIIALPPDFAGRSHPNIFHPTTQRSHV